MAKRCWSSEREKSSNPCWARTRHDRVIQQGLKADGFELSITKLCHWFGVARRSVYYKPSRAAPKVDPAFAEPIKALIEEEPSFGYRTVANLLGFNNNTAQRIFKLKG